jgi:outer membrane translocation and assembly module TamA
MGKKYLILLFFNPLVFFISNSFYGQKFSVKFISSDSSGVYSRYLKPKHLKNSEELRPFLRNYRLNLIDEGYFLVSTKITNQDQNSVDIHVDFDKKFERIQLKINSEQKKIFKKAGITTKVNRDFMAFRPSELKQLLSKILNYYLNNGFPFAEVGFQNSDLDDDQLTCELEIKTGKLFRWNAINLKGNVDISLRSLQTITGVIIDEPFSEEILNLVDKRLEQTIYFKKAKASEILFTEEGVELFVYLESQKVSSIQGAVGLQPNPITQRVGLTGDIQVKLLNSFNKGENLDLNWRSIQPQTQALNLKFVYPYLFQTPFGIDARFNLFKRDSSFLDVKTNLGIQYQLTDGSILKAFYQLSSSDLLYGSSNSIFSKLSKVRSNAYGLSFFRRKLDYIPNPMKGNSLLVEVAVGSRKTILDSVKNSLMGRINLQYQQYFQLYGRNILKLAANFESYYAPEVFQNELYRFGGINSFRGFNEEELFASTKLITTLEYRFIVDRNSNAFLFYDQAFYENTALNYLKDHPFGVGAGFSFGTKLGIFTISYALGKQLSNNLDFRSGKIHFGYTAYF